MNTSVINLREKREPEKESVLPIVVDSIPSDDTLVWEAPEYTAYIYRRGWYIFIGVATAILVLWGIVARNYFFLVLVTLSLALTLYYARRAPRIVSFAITPQGIESDGVLQPFSDFKSFWIFKRPFGNELSLESKKTFSQPLSIPLSNIDPLDVREVLLRTIPEVEQQETTIDQLGRMLGF